MNRLAKLGSYIDIGGLPLPFLILSDMLLNEREALLYLQNKLETAYPEEYPRLLKDLYNIRTGEELHLDNPKTFNEKIQWLKIYDQSPLRTRLADKYLVREWVKDKIGGSYLIPLLGVWNSFNEVDFDSLPDTFILKCNHGYAFNLAVTDKKAIDFKKAKQDFDRWMKCNYAFCSLELQYRDIPRKILAEKYIEQKDGKLMDYKIYVFHGEPKIIHLIWDRDSQNNTAKQYFMTTEWHPMKPLYTCFTMNDCIPEKPSNLDEMLEIAGVLGKGFRHVRVDLYNLDGEIKFGEMTFTSASGYTKGDKEMQKLAGSWIDLG